MFPGGIGYGTSFGDPKFRKIYVQPAIGSRGTKIELAGGDQSELNVNTKMNMLYWDEPQRDWIEEYSNNFYIEPFMLARFGGEKTKFHVGHEPSLIPIATQTDLPCLPSTITLGAIVRLGKKEMISVRRLALNRIMSG